MIPFGEYLQAFMETEKTEELVVGAWHRGHSRAVYVFRGQVVYCDSTCSHAHRLGGAPLGRALSLLSQEPRDTWWTDFCMAGRQRAERIARRFGGNLMVAPYAPEDSWCFVFDTVERIAAFMHAREAGVLEPLPSSPGGGREGG